jgi:hypothetical protein
MKKFIFVVLSFVVCLSSFAQETLKIDEATISKMSLSELQAYQKTLRVQHESQKSDIPSASKLQEYAVVGKALGQAFKECWTTVSTDAEKFAQSPAGKWTAFLITWKVMGQDAIDIVRNSVRWSVGGFLLIIGVPFFIFLIWRNCITKSQLNTVERTGVFTWKKTYAKEMYDPPHCNEGVILYGLSFLIFLVAVFVIMFAR